MYVWHYFKKVKPCCQPFYVSHIACTTPHHHHHFFFTNILKERISDHYNFCAQINDMQYKYKCYPLTRITPLPAHTLQPTPRPHFPCISTKKKDRTEPERFETMCTQCVLHTFM